MSKFLAPIHSWLFNKVKLSESIEKEIIAAFNLATDPADQPFLTNLYKSIGTPLGDEAIEDLIDVNNIHGWLQGRIHQTEQRSAALITYVIQHKPNGLSQLEEVYKAIGKSLIPIYALNGAITPEMAFKKIHDILLEGMPCDRVHQIVSQDATHIRWDAYQCLHQNYFEKVDGEISTYYALKSVLISALLSEANPPLDFTLTTAAPDAEALYINTITQN